MGDGGGTRQREKGEGRSKMLCCSVRADYGDGDGGGDVGGGALRYHHY